MRRQKLVNLIDAAKLATGSDYKTAQQMHVSRFTLSDWRRGTKHMPAVDAALMAHIAGLNAVEWGLKALISLHEGTQKGEDVKAAIEHAQKALAAHQHSTARTKVAVQKSVNAALVKR
jgi:hypothetical protein